MDLLDDLINKVGKVSDLYAKKCDINRDPNWYVHKIQEEVGELVKAYLSMSNGTRDKRPINELKESFEDELADVFSQVLLLAREQKVDLSKALQRKWFRYL